MKLKNVLSEKLVAIDLKGTNKEEIIQELLQILVDNGKLKDKELAFNNIMERENQMSTGIQQGVAIPHAKTKAVDNLVACIGVKKDGVDFSSLDGEPSNIFILTLSPSDHIGPHVQFLAEISRIIRTEESRTKILEATSTKQVLSVFGI
ncbi:MAG: PTS sugar transporter subunit IIA [Sphaerochaetaceae bacterium]|nr:PTS sugar transporter subunit IIA [Sphaerochaetaceae bacterium]